MTLRVGYILIVALCAATGSRGETPPGTGSQPPVVAVESIGLTVSDLDQAIAYFTNVLTFEKETEVEMSGEAFEHLTGVFGARAQMARMKLGEEYIELTEYLTPRGRPIPADSRSFDHWFQHIAIVVSDMDTAYQRLREHKVRHVSTGPQKLPDWNPNAGGIEAFYFQDQDGHVLEVIHFPPGKGDPKWQRPTDKLFLGIDHTAIVVSDTEASLRFYRDTLGMRVAGESENYGTEQEHLNQVFGARLRITALRAPAGPGVEFLEYITPPGGRPYPPDEQANDLFHWRTIMTTSDASSAFRALRAARIGLISSAEPPTNRSQQAFLARDPDGHAVQIQ